MLSLKQRCVLGCECVGVFMNENIGHQQHRPQVPSLLSLVHPVHASDPAISLNAITVLLAIMASGDAAMTHIVHAGILPKALDALRDLGPPQQVNATLTEVLLDVCCRVGSAPEHRHLLLEHDAVPVLLDQLQETPSDGVVRALLALGMVANCQGVLMTIAKHRYMVLWRCMPMCEAHTCYATSHPTGRGSSVFSG